MSYTHSRESPRRERRSTGSPKNIRALSAFDAGEEDFEAAAAAPSVPMGKEVRDSSVVEQIVFDPAFRRRDFSGSRGRRERNLHMSTPRRSCSRGSVIESNNIADGGLGDCRAPPQSSSTASWSAASRHSHSQSPSRLASSMSSIHGQTNLPGLQAKIEAEEYGLDPLAEEELDPASFDLVVPAHGLAKPHGLESQSELLFSVKHLAAIFDDPGLLQRFNNYLHTWRPESIPLLTYYLDALKALKAVEYANALSASLQAVDGVEVTAEQATVIDDHALREKANLVFQILAANDLPAFITQTYVQTVSITIKRRIANTLPPQLREQSEGLAEVFCLTDPSRPDNPIVFASEEFHRTTQYGPNHVFGRNCRFLQGPKTNPFSIRRIREKLDAGKEHCETFLNYRRDGSPFMNLLMVAPLLDSRGVVRYHIGAQVDVSGLVKSGAGLESFAQLKDREFFSAGSYDESPENKSKKKPQQQKEGKTPMEGFRELAEMFNLPELKIVRESGGALHRVRQEETRPVESVHNWNKPRLVIQDDASIDRRLSDPIIHPTDHPSSGRLRGVYEHYLLVRPYPNLRVLFASPSLRVPGMLQSVFTDRIGGSSMVRETITQALAEGNGITAKVRWTTRMGRGGRGRPRWIHCTPLFGYNGTIGVWMVVLVDDEFDGASGLHTPPAVDAPRVGRSVASGRADEEAEQDDDQMDLASFAEAHRAG